MNAPHAPCALVERRLRLTGIVQGVGLRPQVWRLATELGLTGWVRNDPAGVEILVQGAPEAVASFTRRLPRELPPLARLRELSWTDAPLGEPSLAFVIADSIAGRAATLIGPDTAVCPACLAEMFDPNDRRWRYAFTNCTQCGPRYTLTRALPYDRARTSMAAFPMCPDCEREYHDPADRRFHAEPIACPACGPKLWLEPLADPVDAIPAAADPIAQALVWLRAGRIVAIKGLGGFHLACDARNREAVARLRARKGRDEKPFALMVANPASIAPWAQLDGDAQALLASPERPIVLLSSRGVADAALPGVATGLAWLGVMLPYTPLHWLLFHEAAGRPAGTAWMQAPQDLVLVMTSANPGGEPLVRDNDEARRRLAGIADALLLHDRDILVRCDDSVVRPDPHRSASPAFIRRARGYTPRAIRLTRTGPPVLATGGYFKNTVCITRGDEAFVSQHIGGLDNAATCRMHAEVCAHLLALVQVRPRAIAHDLHPDYPSTRYAQALAAELGVPAVPVQHHHAHIAAVAAEHGHAGPLLGLALDGVGLGSDGTAWGGELLQVDGAVCLRLGHLRPLPLPGGDRAAREPWRMAAAVLHALGRGREIARRFPGEPHAALLAELLERGHAFPVTTGMGRWFDAAAGLLGVRGVVAYEGQAAMLLEGLAERAGDIPPLAGGWRLGPDGVLDLLPLMRHLADEGDAGRGAALFHATLAQALAAWVRQVVHRTGLKHIALGGGCFLNHLLTRRLEALLRAEGLSVLRAGQIPPNDGGLSLGQAWVAMSSLD